MIGYFFVNYQQSVQHLWEGNVTRDYRVCTQGGTSYTLHTFRWYKKCTLL